MSSTSPKQGVGLNPNTHVHLTEHLAPICIIMGIPLLLTDPVHEQFAKKYYPGLQTLLVNWQEVTPEYLIQNFDVFFQSEPWTRQKFYQTFQQLEEDHGKTVRNVFCPHGFSDKLFWFEQCVWEDIALIYGQNMTDMFKDLEIDQHLNATVRTGNYRYQYYRANQDYYDKIVEKEIWSRFDRSQPTILYAPTCNDMESNSSFFDSDSLMSSLPDSYNLLVKPHPILEGTNGSAFYKILGKYEKKKNIVFIKDFTLVYPILARADIYLGDMSSLGYDFLTFNKPMFFLNQNKRDPKKDRNLFLYRCGTEIMPDQYKDFYSILGKALPLDQERFSAIRKDVYQYTFGEEIPFEQLKMAIINSYSSSKKWD